MLTDRERQLSARVGSPEPVMSVFEQTPIALVAMEGPDLVVAAVNPAYAGFFTEADVVGRPVREVTRLEGQQLYELIERVYHTGEPVTLREMRIQVDPSDPDSERFATVTVSPWRNPDGSIRGVLGRTLDVTEEVLARRAVETRAAGAQQRYEAAQEVVLTLQRSLLPEALPLLPQARLSAEYLVAGAELQAGGDWFDAVPLGGGRVALVIGDVVGHGAQAAAAMAQLRPVLHEALASGTPLDQAVDRLDTFARYTPDTRAATVCVAVLDPADGSLQYMTRAHPPPLVCSLNGTTRYLPETSGGPLGVGAAASEPAAAHLHPNEVLLLYSDGLIERPGQTTNDGLDALAHTASSATTTRGRTVAPNPADRITSLVVERLARTGYIDDVTVLAAHRLPAPTPLFEARLESGLHELPEMRAALLGWLDQLGARRDDQLAVTLATWEAAANALEHAHHRREPQPGRVLARLDGDGAVTITIEDSGRWREPQSHRGGGRGLNLIRSLSDEVQIERGAGGTTLTLRRRLLHPTVIGLSEHLAPTAMAMPRFQAAITRVDPTVLEITGPLDATTTDQLRAAVMHHANAADQPLVVDLTPVSFLASSGVQLLHDLSADLGDGLRLHATPGCPAAYVLKLTGLDRLLAQTEAGCHR